jgi:hypothetical protein
VLSAPLVKQLGLLGAMQSTYDLLGPSYTSSDLFPDDLVALKLAIAAIEQTTKANDPGRLDPVIRYNSGQIGDLDETLRMLRERVACIGCVHYTLCIR